MRLLDTIVARATPTGPGARAILRLTGPACLTAMRAVFAPADSVSPGRVQEGGIRLPGLALLPATLYFWPAGRSYTNQDLAELHTLSSPPLLDRTVAELLNAGCRAAGPGEFTLRAFLAGKLDLTRAEAVHAVIEASGRGDLRHSLQQLAGGVANPLQTVREDLLNLLADVEAALDFADEDIRFVDEKELLLRLGNAMARVTLAGRQLDSRTLHAQPFRAVLAGRPNAGKSSLFNALTGGRAIVSEQPGTTRDYLTGRLSIEGGTIELLDTPGSAVASNVIEEQAQALGRVRRTEADVVLLCVPVGESPTAEELALLQGGAIAIATKCDQGSTAVGWLATSATRKLGLETLRAVLQERYRQRAEPALAPSVGRCRHHVTACLEHLRRAHANVLENDPPEILALELREALQQLGEMTGAVYTEDLLDRIFSRFCIGK